MHPMNLYHEVLRIVNFLAAVPDKIVEAIFMLEQLFPWLLKTKNKNGCMRLKTLTSTTSVDDTLGTGTTRMPI